MDVRETGCGDYRLGLGVYALGCLPPPEADELRAHLGDCPACRAELAELRRVTEILDRAMRPSGAASGDAPGGAPAPSFGAPRSATRKSAGRRLRTGASPRGALSVACAARGRAR
jgi:anti-sigma factor RsiW